MTTTKMLTQKFISSFYVLVMVGTVVSPYEQYLKDLFRHCIMKEKLLSITYSYNMKMFLHTTMHLKQTHLMSKVSY